MTKRKPIRFPNVLAAVRGWEENKRALADALLAELGTPPKSLAQCQRRIEAGYPEGSFDDYGGAKRAAMMWRVAAVFPIGMRRRYGLALCAAAGDPATLAAAVSYAKTSGKTLDAKLIKLPCRPTKRATCASASAGATLISDRGQRPCSEPLEAARATRRFCSNRCRVADPSRRPAPALAEVNRKHRADTGNILMRQTGPRRGSQAAGHAPVRRCIRCKADMQAKLMKALDELREGVEATQRLLLERCEMRADDDGQFKCRPQRSVRRSNKHSEGPCHPIGQH